MRYALALGVATVFIWLTFRDVQWLELTAAMKTFPLGAALLALAAVSLGYAVRIFRWLVMIRVFNPRCQYYAAAGPFLGSFALNNVVPARAGDAVRAFAFRDQIGISPSRATGTMLIERILDLYSVLFLIAAGFALSGGMITTPGLDQIIGVVLVAGIVAGLVCLFAARRIARWFRTLSQHRRINKVPLVSRMTTFMARAFFAVGRIASPVRLLFLIGLSLAGWALEGLVFYAVAIGLLLPGGLAAAFFTAGVATLMTLVPGTPGHVGTFDFGARVGFIVFGATVEGATAAALITHIVIWLPITVVGGLWLLIAWAGPSGIRRRLPTVAEAAPAASFDDHRK